MTDDVRRTFALFIEASGPRRAAAEARARAGPSAIDSAQQRWSGRVLGPAVRREQVEEVLGAPDVSDAASLGYSLSGYPGHVFTFEFDDRGCQRRAAFRRRGEAAVVPAPPADPFERLSYLRSLSALGVTEEELVEVLGEPIAREGWWPCETLRFRFAGGLEIELRHGMVLAD